MKKLTLSVAALTIAMMSYGQTQCKELTKDSVQCKNTTKSGNKCKSKTKDKSGRCHHHRKND